MTDKESEISKSELNDELNLAIQNYLDNGGEIIKLRSASEEDQKRAAKMAFHLDKQHSSERSKKIVEEEREKEGNFIFSRLERNLA